MKSFLQKSFSPVHPAQGKLTGLTVLLALVWTIPAVVLLNREIPGIPFLLTAVILSLLIFEGQLLCCLFLGISAGFCRNAEEPKPDGRLYRIAELATLGATVAAAFLLRSPGWVFFILLAGIVLTELAGPSEYRKQRLAAGICLCLSAGCFAIAGRVWLFDWLNGPPDEGLQSIAAQAVLETAGIILLAAGYLLTARLLARQAQLPFRKIFSPACRIVLGVWAAFYLVTLGLAIAAHCRAERDRTALERHFGRPLTIGGVLAAYRENRPVDPKFWDELKNCIEQLDSTPDLIAGTPKGIYPEETLRQFRAKFEGPEVRKQLERMLARRLPAREYRLVTGDMIPLALEELNWCRTVCRWELWNVRFALEDGDLPRAYGAMNRMKLVSDYLGNRPSSMLSTLVMITCEDCRIRAMERLLASGKVPGSVLKQWQSELERDERDVPRLFSDTVYTEAVFLDGYLTGSSRDFAGGRTVGDKTGTVAVCLLGGFCPPLRYYLDAARAELLERMKDGTLFDDGRSVKGSSPLWSWVRTYASFKKKTFVLTAEYRAMRALIGAELEKRRTGKYPDTLENPPIDPFTGKPMLWRKGQVTVNALVWNAEKKQFGGNLVRQVPGVAVISAGLNGKYDVGATLVFPAEKGK